MSALPELTARAKIAWKAWTHTFGMTGGLMRHDQGDEAYVAGYVAGFEDAALAAAARLRTELEAAKGDAGWRPMKDAPRDGTPIVAHYFEPGPEGDYDAYAVIEWDELEDAGWVASDDILPSSRRFEAWKPLGSPYEARSALTADKSEAEVRQQEQIREDERDRLYETAANSKDFEALGMLSSRGAMRPEERARSRAQGGMDKGVGG